MKHENKREKIEKIPKTLEVAKLLKSLGQSLITMPKKNKRSPKSI
jgi:hypothetical protein